MQEVAPKDSEQIEPRVVLQVERMVAGGLGLGRDESGRILLVEGGLPGERVAVHVTQSSQRMARGVVREVLAPAEGRRVAPCAEVDAGCGGCDLQHAQPDLQLRVKVEIVTDALFRIAHLSQVPISIGQELPSTRYRTTLRCAVTAHASEARPALEISHAGQIDAVAQVGAVGFRKRQSHEVHPVASCLVAHPLIEELMQAGNFAGATEVTFRVGARTAERMVIVAGQAKPNKAFGLPEDVRVVAQEALSGGAQAWIHEHVAGHRFRISARSFFQARPDGAEALIAAVARAVAPFDAVSDRLVDLYGGVGLFTAGLSAQRAVLVERSESSISDARINLAELGTKIFSGSVERWKPVAADVVVADPARAGLNVSGVAAISATGAERVALVSCDPASLARDLALFVQAGFEVGGVELVDMFPQTHHIETVATLRRVSASKVAE